MKNKNKYSLNNKFTLGAPYGTPKKFPLRESRSPLKESN